MSLVWNTQQLLSGDRTGIASEYHFLSHRELYDSSIQTVDRHHSSAGEWAVCGDHHWYSVAVITRPVYSLPQELCLSFDCYSRTETFGSNASMTGALVHEVALEYGMLLSLLAREPLLPLGERRINGKPIRLENRSGNVHRAPHAGASAAGINSVELRKILEGLAKANDADAAALLAAMRFYHAALSLAQYDVSTAYFSLVSAIECVAGHHFEGRSCNFDDVEKFRTTGKVITKIAAQFTDDTLINDLKRELLKAEHFVGQKFRDFIEAFLPEDFWLPDKLHPSGDGLPQIDRTKLRKFVTEAYSARSRYAHTGEPFPAYVAIGTSDWVSSRAMMEAISLVSSSGSFVPSFVWFERLTHSVLREYIRQTIAA